MKQQLLTINQQLLVINVKKLQLIHSVNGDRSKTANVIKRSYPLSTNLSVSAMLIYICYYYQICI